MATASMISHLIDGAELLRLGKKVTICSYFPNTLTVRRNYKTTPSGGYLTHYRLPACPVGSKEPAQVVIGDGFEWTYIGEGRHQSIPVPGGAKAIAEDIVNAVRTNAVGATSEPLACPGIWICEGDSPTEEEKARWLAAQEAYFRALVADADEIWFQSKSGRGSEREIGSLHRTAATWLQFDPRQHEWVMGEKKGSLKQCQFCSSDIDSMAVKCPRCSEIVDAIRYTMLKRQSEEAQAILSQPPPPVTIPSEPPRPMPGSPIKAPMR